jgi:hypothetical protein
VGGATQLFFSHRVSTGSLGLSKVFCARDEYVGDSEPSTLPDLAAVRMLGDVERYRQQINEGELPRGLTTFRHSIDFPFDVKAQEIHIAGFHGFRDYPYQKSRDRIHDGIDIQLAAGTNVFTPEDCLLVHSYIDYYTLRGRCGLYLYGIETGILYCFGELQTSSLPRIVPENRRFVLSSEILIKKGEFVGRVFEWPLELRTWQVDIPEDVQKVHGRHFHHLHVQTGYVPREDLNSKMLETWKGFNPLLLLKPLF